VFDEKMFSTSFLNFSMRNVSIARIVCAEINVVRALRFRRGTFSLAPFPALLPCMVSLTGDSFA